MFLLDVETTTLFGETGDLQRHLIGRLERMNEVVEPETTLWRGLLGCGPGTYAYVTPFESRVQFAAAVEAVETDTELAANQRSALEFTKQLPNHHLLSLIHGSFGDHVPIVGGVASVVWTNLVLEKMAEATGWAFEITDLAEAATGIPGVLMIDQHSGYGRVTWMSVADDISAMDHTETTLSADGPYVESTMRGAGLGGQGAGRMTLWTRIA